MRKKNTELLSDVIRQVLGELHLDRQPVSLRHDSAAARFAAGGSVLGGHPRGLDLAAPGERAG